VYFLAGGGVVLLGGQGNVCGVIVFVYGIMLKVWVYLVYVFLDDIGVYAMYVICQENIIYITCIEKGKVIPLQA
jgi:hypothetical protein